MPVNLLLAKEISQRKQKSKYFILCHIGEFSERTRDLEEYHQQTRDTAKESHIPLLTAQFLSATVIQGHTNSQPSQQDLCQQNSAFLLQNSFKEDGKNRFQSPGQNQQLPKSHLRDTDIYLLCCQSLQPVFLRVLSVRTII